MLFLLVLLLRPEGGIWAKGGVPFNPVTDILWSEIEPVYLGVCVCPEPPPLFFTIGEVWSYWEPYIAIDTVSEPFYSPFWGTSLGGSLLDELGGKNGSQDAVSIANESTFAQAHAWPLPLLEGLLCARSDYPLYMSELDPLWQYDELSMLLHPEALLYANPAMQMACMADAVATNAGTPLDVMPWCIGSGGSSYPMTGHVDNDNIVQANNTAAARLIYRLNRIGMVCDPADNPCGCLPTPVWIKSHYKLHVVRPGLRSPAWPVGVTASVYNSGLNTPFVGAMGPNDEFLWIVYRKQLCCTCCD